MTTTLEEIAEKGKAVDLSLLRSLLPDDHLNRAVVRACERLELAVSNRKKGFISKVEVLMSVLESLLTDCLVRLSPETTSVLFEYILKHTLLLVLHGDWGKYNAIKSHMGSLFKRFKVRAERKKLVKVTVKIDYLLRLMQQDPWGDVVLRKIFKDERETNDELMEFVRSELGICLNFRLEVLMYARCEMQAMVLAEKCLCCVSIPGNSEFFQNFTDEITRMRSIYLLVLNKAKGNKYIRGKIRNEVKKMGLKECLKFMCQCRNGELPYEMVSKKSANVVASVALALAVVEENTDEGLLREMIQLWFDTFVNDRILLKLLKHMVLNAVCSRYIYCFGERLIESAKLAEKESCVEIFVRGLTLNVNEIERYKTTEDPVKVEALKAQMSNGFLQLADYLEKDVLLCCECVLAAFSLTPSQSGVERIKVLGTKINGIENILLLNKPGERAPKGDENQATMDQSELEMPTLLSQPVISQMRPDEMRCFYREPPTLSPQRPFMNDTVCLDILKDWSDPTDPTQQNEVPEILDAPQMDVDESSEEITHTGLSQQVTFLSLGDVNSDSHDKENKAEDIKFCTKSRHLQLRAFQAEAAGMSQILCDDLSTLVYSVKNRDFTWDLEWPQLVRRCEKYVSEWRKWSTNVIDWSTIKVEMSRSETLPKTSKRKRKRSSRMYR